jgi:hypothetical protein
VCGIFIKAKKTKANPGPQLCEDILECGSCTSPTITANLKDASGGTSAGGSGCVWSNAGWYSKSRDKKIKCASKQWVQTKATDCQVDGEQCTVGMAVTDCSVDPNKCRNTDVNGKWSSADIEGKPVTTRAYGELVNRDCIKLVTGGCTDKVQIFQHGDFTGWEAKLGKGSHDNSKADVAVSSIKVPAGCVATLYQHAPKSGWSATFHAGDYDYSEFIAAGAKNDDTSAIDVTDALTAPIPAAGYATKAQAIETCETAGSTCGGLLHEGRSGKWYLCKREQTVSQKIALEHSQTEDGLRETFGKGKCLQADQLGMSVKDCSAGQLNCNGDVVLFGGTAYTGWMATFQPGSYTAEQYLHAGATADDVASLRVPVGCKAMLYPEDNFQGTPVVISAGHYPETPAAKNKAALVEDEIGGKDEIGVENELLQVGYGISNPFSRPSPPPFDVKECAHYRKANPGYYADGCQLFEKSRLKMIYDKVQTKAFSHINKELSFTDLKSIKSLRIVDDNLHSVTLDESGNPTAAGRTEMQGDEWIVNSYGHAKQAQTEQTISIAQDIPKEGSPLSFGEAHNLPFCWGGDNGKCDQTGQTSPLMNIKYPSGDMYRSCKAENDPVCPGTDLGHSDQFCAKSCAKQRPGSYLKEKVQHKIGVGRMKRTYRTEYYCVCESGCVYNDKCKKKIDNRRGGQTLHECRHLR